VQLFHGRSLARGKALALLGTVVLFANSASSLKHTATSTRFLSSACEPGGSGGIDELAAAVLSYRHVGKPHISRHEA
jgi:hypothetical protein